MNYYVVLGIDQGADPQTIRSAFRAQARRYHPDAGAGSCSTEFRRVVEAYETLVDPERRRVYDLSLRVQRPSRVVEPLSNRVTTIEPLASPSHPRVAHSRTGDAVYRQFPMDHSVRELFHFFELSFWSGRTRGRV
jgi:curved DNA-binding protein CbpA